MDSIKSQWGDLIDFDVYATMDISDIEDKMR
jgi:hypothetical protein